MHHLSKMYTRHLTRLINLSHPKAIYKCQPRIVVILVPISTTQSTVGIRFTAQKLLFTWCGGHFFTIERGNTKLLVKKFHCIGFPIRELC